MTTFLILGAAGLVALFAALGWVVLMVDRCRTAREEESTQRSVIYIPTESNLPMFLERREADKQ
jgi:hypothetical protein